MFERFTSSAREAITRAVQLAERRQAPAVTGEHLLLAVVDAAGTTAAGLLADHGLTPADAAEEVEQASRRAGLSGEEASALRELGIDVDAVVERIERVHGEGALAGPRRRRRHRPFTAEAKAVLERALRETVDLHDRHIGDEHLLLAMAARPGVPGEVLASYGVTYNVLRAQLAQAS